jgi:hypothetical protein
MVVIWEHRFLIPPVERVYCERFGREIVDQLFGEG